MFGNRPRHSESFSSRYGAGKSTRPSKRSFKEPSSNASLQRAISGRSPSSFKSHKSPPMGSSSGSTLTSAIITICVGPEQRLFAGHEDVLSRSPFFEAACRNQFYDTSSRRISLPDESPEVLSAILEYLYKGDYQPVLLHNKAKDTWELGESANGEDTVCHHAMKQPILKDTAVYCAASRYSLPELQRIALRKQGLRCNVQITTILASARWAYAHTPDDDVKLRAHYLSLIIRSRGTFKRSGTMKTEMEKGGLIFFDLFVTMCNHMDDLQTVRSPYRR
ncbi:hypothetical protein DV735_g5009, partial [Chaetothyriales sp. CBS 134920]